MKISIGYFVTASLASFCVCETMDTARSKYIQRFGIKKNENKNVENVSETTKDTDEVIKQDEIQFQAEESGADIIENNEFCTCGVFMSGQFNRGSSKPPRGDPVVAYEPEGSVQCGLSGVEDCRKKCIEAMMQHVSKSDNVICASLDRDIVSEKAHLFVKVCDGNFVNTKFFHGKPYCCKDRQPQKCNNKRSIQTARYR